MERRRGGLRFWSFLETALWCPATVRKGSPKFLSDTGVILLVGWGFAFWGRGGRWSRRKVWARSRARFPGDWWIELLLESSKVWAW
uniref:Uncharacterized protein n=1 Tax=Oryza punctata TaxID=4537 RepID=A0A0E0K891_ORYPU